MNWAILATGTIAAKFAETVNGMKGEDRLAACGSRSREKAEAFGRKYGIPRAYGSYEELLRDEEVDAVYVATPNNMHYAELYGMSWKRESMCYVRSPYHQCKGRGTAFRRGRGKRPVHHGSLLDPPSSGPEKDAGADKRGSYRPGGICQV
ncbi:MAG: Gfo/Idh/MocA family protein [Enterocloster bolteae]